MLACSAAAAPLAAAQTTADLATAGRKVPCGRAATIIGLASSAAVNCLIAVQTAKGTRSGQEGSREAAIRLPAGIASCAIGAAKGSARGSGPPGKGVAAKGKGRSCGAGAEETDCRRRQASGGLPIAGGVNCSLRII